MNYEIYRTRHGRRVNIGNASYELEVFNFRPGAVNSFNVGDAYDGTRSSDPVLDAWLQAAKEVGVPLRYAWRGIMNSLGHHGSVSPPWRPKARDYQRDDDAPLLPRNWKVWVEWQPKQFAEYTIGDPHQHGHLSCWNEEKRCFNGFEAIGKPIYSNVPEIASYVTGREVISYVGSFEELEELGGTKIPCPIYA